MLDDRKAAILQVLVEEYIKTGEPVSSRAVLDAGSFAVSSATVRNELVALERDGYVMQPHTSAGRVPTDAGYRYYIDHINPGQLRAPTRTAIHVFFASVQDELEDVLQQTSDLLSRLTLFPAVVMGPTFGPDTIHAVDLVPVSDHSFLVVVITSAGRVGKDVARIAASLEERDVRSAERILNRATVGKSLQEARSALEGLSVDDLTPPVAAIITATAAAISADEEAGREVFVGGTSRLAGLWEDLHKVHALLEALERETSLLVLFESPQAGTSVLLGGEIPSIGDDDFAVVSTGFASSGRVGVIGPKRMDYRRTIRVVEEVGDGLTDRLGAE